MPTIHLISMDFYNAFLARLTVSVMVVVLFDSGTSEKRKVNTKQWHTLVHFEGGGGATASGYGTNCGFHSKGKP